MKDLIELARIVTKKKIAKVEILDDSDLKNGNSLYGDFYEALINQQFASDDDAAKFFYDADPLDDRYRQLKSRTKKRLLNHLYYLDVNQSSFSNYRKAYLTCYKNWSLIKILLINSARHTFEKLARQTVNQALKFNFTDLVVLCSKHLCYHYSISGDKKNFHYYDEILVRHLDILNAEVKVERLLQHIYINTSKASTYSSEIKELAMENTRKVEEIQEQYDSFLIQYYNFIIHCISGQINTDHEEVITYCDKAEDYIEENPQFHQDEVLAIFALFKIGAYLQLRDYENGSNNAEKCLTFFQPGSNNWFLFLEYYFLLAMHTENYEKAAEIYTTTTSHPRFKMVNKLRLEKWKIFEAYLNYIISSENVNTSSFATEDNSFKIYKFLNEVPTFTKDKSGYNVAIIVLQVLYLLEKDDFDGIIDMAESMRMYNQRHLKEQENPRSYYFIKMIRKMEHHSFDHEKTIRSTQDLLDKLQQEQNAVSEWEIIPYEKLWQKIMKKLEEDEAI